MHKDQKRVRDVLLPQVMDRVLSDDPAAVLDSTLLNRALLQGPDPLFLMETCPEQFRRICLNLNLDLASGRDAIEQAHVKGPGVLLEGKGLPLEPRDENGRENLVFASDVREAWKREALWLVLASISDCTEQGYTTETTMLDRLQRVMKSATNFEARLDAYAKTGLRGAGGQCENASALDDALDAAKQYVATTQFTTDAQGIPHGEADHAFYVAYKLGHKAVAALAGDKTFWGTTPDTNLAEQGIHVDVEITPCFGYTRNA